MPQAAHGELVPTYAVTFILNDRSLHAAGAMNSINGAVFLFAVILVGLAFPGALPAEFAVYFYVSAGGLLLGLALWNLLESWRQPLIEATPTEKDYLRLQCAWLLLKAKQEAGDMGGWSYKLEATSGANPAAPVPLKLRPGVLHTSNI